MIKLLLWLALVCVNFSISVDSAQVELTLYLMHITFMVSALVFTLIDED